MGKLIKQRARLWTSFWPVFCSFDSRKRPKSSSMFPSQDSPGTGKSPAGLTGTYLALTWSGTPRAVGTLGRYHPTAAISLLADVPFHAGGRKAG